MLAIGLLGALTAAFFYGLFDAVALGARPGFLFWIMLAIAVSLDLPATESSPGNHDPTFGSIIMYSRPAAPCSRPLKQR